MLVHDQLICLRRNEATGYSDRDHLVAAATWLARAQDAQADGGISGRYSLKTGWSSSYPETTGYIVPTFLALAKEVDPSFLKRAERCIEFLKAIQLPDGAFPGGEVKENRTRPSIFNSCQILHGLVAWHAATGDEDTARAARRAAGWLVAQQDPDGAWRKHIYQSVTTYTSHASCWLAEAGRHFGVEAWIRSAERHLDWVLSHVDHATGWIDLAGFAQEDHEHQRAVTHTLAYTVWGVLHLSLLLGRDDATAVARRAAERVARRLELLGWLPGEINSQWKAARNDYACLTGNAQMALIWFRLAALDRDARFINAAIKAIELVKRAQPMESHDPGIRGGIPGSAPIWGDYLYMALPNWAAKFYVDALIAKQQAVAAVMRHTGAAWHVPDDIPRTVPIVNGSPLGGANIVLLSSPGSHKVRQMVRSWAAWGFRPHAVVLEERVSPSRATRLASRVQRDGVVATLGAVRERMRRSAAASPETADVNDVVAFCQAEGISLIRVPSLSLPESVAAVRKLQPDLLVHAGAGILRRDLLATSRLGTLNAHMGILPRYRGMNVAEWSRLESNPVGCTVHLVDEGIDTGDILVIQQVDTKRAGSVAELRDLVDQAQIDLLGRVVRFVVATGSLPPRRSQRLDEGRQYFRMHDDLKAVLQASLTAESRGRPVNRPS